MDSNGFFRPTKDKAKAPIKFALGKPKLTFHIGAGASKKDAAHSAASVFGRLSPTEVEKTEVKIKTEEDPVDSVQQTNQLKPVPEVAHFASIPSRLHHLRWMNWKSSWSCLGPPSSRNQCRVSKSR